MFIQFPYMMVGKLTVEIATGKIESSIEQCNSYGEKIDNMTG